MTASATETSSSTTDDTTTTTTNTTPATTVDPTTGPGTTTTTTDSTATSSPTTTDNTSTTMPATSTDSTDTTDTTATTGTGTDTDTDTDSTTGNPLSLCERLGGEGGIGELVTTAFGVVLADDRVNGYFLNSDVDAVNLGGCLVKQIGEAVECPGVVYDCLDMVTAHAGLGISTIDFTDFAEDFSAALDTHQMAHPDLTDADKMAILTTLGGMAPDIVEDANNDLTVYQRVGRKPAIRTLIGKPSEAGSFVDNVANDAAINGFFGGADFDRLNTCLTRQVGGIDGPTKYTLEVDAPPPADPGVGAGNPCRDMATTHTGLLDANDNIGIDINDFGALVADLVTAMQTAGVQQADQDAILAVLGPMCEDILAPEFKNQCPSAQKLEVIDQPNIGINIVDNGYDGTKGSMACQNFIVPDDPINFVASVEVTIGVDHGWVGDVVAKVYGPNDMPIVTLVNRPGAVEVDDIGGDPGGFGDSSDLQAAFPITFKDSSPNQAEQMGAAITGAQVVCKDDGGLCDWTPNPGTGPGVKLADFFGLPAAGTWSVCIGDTGGAITGPFKSGKLSIQRVKYDPSP